MSMKAGIRDPLDWVAAGFLLCAVVLHVPIMIIWHYAVRKNVGIIVLLLPALACMVLWIHWNYS
jgi:hypothetical protein